MALSSNALCAKAKAMYGNRLQQDGYAELARKQTIGEMVTYLKSQTRYESVLSDVNVRNVHRGQLEASLNKEYFERCARLMKYAPKKNEDFYLQEVVGIEINLIMDKIMSIKAKEKYSFNLSIPDYLTNKTSFNIYGLINVESYKELIIFLRDTRYYSILKDFDFNPPVDFNGLEQKLQKLYIENTINSIKNNFKGNTQKELLDLFYTSIELKNITKIYRFKKYFNESSEVIRNSLYLGNSRLPKVMIEQLINASGSKEVLQILSTSKYNIYLDDRDFAYIEYYVENIKYNIAKRYMRFSSSAPLVYMTYCILQRVEIDNLKHIIEGIRYGRDASSIEESLIYA